MDPRIKQWFTPFFLADTQRVQVGTLNIPTPEDQFWTIIGVVVLGLAVISTLDVFFVREYRKRKNLFSGDLQGVCHNADIPDCSSDAECFDYEKPNSNKHVRAVSHQRSVLMDAIRGFVLFCVILYNFLAVARYVHLLPLAPIPGPGFILSYFNFAFLVAILIYGTFLVGHHLNSYIGYLGCVASVVVLTAKTWNQSYSIGRSVIMLISGMAASESYRDGVPIKKLLKRVSLLSLTGSFLYGLSRFSPLDKFMKPIDIWCLVTTSILIVPVTQFHGWSLPLYVFIQMFILHGGSLQVFSRFLYIPLIREIMPFISSFGFACLGVFIDKWYYRIKEYRSEVRSVRTNGSHSTDDDVLPFLGLRSQGIQYQNGFILFNLFRNCFRVLGGIPRNILSSLRFIGRSFSTGVIRWDPMEYSSVGTSESSHGKNRISVEKVEQGEMASDNHQFVPFEDELNLDIVGDREMGTHSDEFCIQESSRKGLHETPFSLEDTVYPFIGRHSLLIFVINEIILSVVVVLYEKLKRR